MKKIVRESKFRHLYGKQVPKEQQYDGITASDTRIEGNICAVNRKFIACVVSSSGAGFFTVLRRDKPGRIEKLYKCIGHSSEIVDISFDRFNPNRIVSGSDDGAFIVWWIPEGGLTEDLDSYQCQLKESHKRAVQSEWHPSAKDILIGVNIDSINIFNVETTSCIRSINTSNMSDQIFNISLNYNGTKCAASFKDKKVRIFDLMKGDMQTEFMTHQGSKTIKLAWLTQCYDDDIIVTTGATKMSTREISAWKISSPNEPICTESLGNASASLYVNFDNDTKLIILYGKGESTIKFFELDIDPPSFHNVATFSSNDSHRGVAIGNKLSCSFSSNEVLHGVRVLDKALEDVSFIVPRKSELFQEDLFPDSASETAAMTAADFEAGKVCDPLIVSLKDYVFPDGSVPVQLMNASSSKSGSKGGAGRTGPGTMLNIVDLSQELAQVKTELEELKSRVAKLEK